MKAHELGELAKDVAGGREPPLREIAVDPETDGDAIYLRSSERIEGAQMIVPRNVWRWLKEAAVVRKTEDVSEALVLGVPVRERPGLWSEAKRVDEGAP